MRVGLCRFITTPALLREDDFTTIIKRHVSSYVLPPFGGLTNNVTDLKGLDLTQMQSESELGTRLKSFERLMGVLLAASVEQVPKAYRVGLPSLRSPRILIVP